MHPQGFCASCGQAMFLPRSSCNRTSAQAKCRSKGKCRRRILPQGTEIAKCCQDRPKRRPQTARTRVYPRTCCDYCDVSSLLLHLFSANIQIQPPVKPFFPSVSPACYISIFSIPHGPQKCNILLSQIHFVFSVYIMPYHRRCAFFTQSSATQPPALRRPQPFAEPTPALSSTTV